MSKDLAKQLRAMAPKLRELSENQLAAQCESKADQLDPPKEPKTDGKS